MDATYAHLLLNHFPVIGTLFGILVLIGGFVIKNEWVKNTAYGIFIVTTLISVPAFLSGGQAEEAVEKLPGIEEAYIEKHEEMAESAIWFAVALGVLSIAALWLSVKSHALQRQFSYLVMVVAFLTFGMMARVNNSGGEIRHTEIRKGAAPSSQGTQESEESDND